jgi:hypothetical protein
VYWASTALCAGPVVASPELALDAIKAPATAIAVRPIVPILIFLSLPDSSLVEAHQIEISGNVSRLEKKNNRTFVERLSTHLDRQAYWPKETPRKVADEVAVAHAACILDFARDRRNSLETLPTS